MTETVELLARDAIRGTDGAALMDAWTLVARRAFNVQGLDYAMLGRWLQPVASPSCPPFRDRRRVDAWPQATHA